MQMAKNDLRIAAYARHYLLLHDATWDAVLLISTICSFITE